MDIKPVTIPKEAITIHSKIKYIYIQKAILYNLQTEWLSLIDIIFLALLED